MIMMKAIRVVLLLLLAIHCSSFVILNNILHGRLSCEARQHVHGNRNSQLYMGRAAAVRAATKARTDSAKAKNNNRFAKAIINVVKQGGPDPESNRNLAVGSTSASGSEVVCLRFNLLVI
jgi:hypothetical protein